MTPKWTSGTISEVSAHPTRLRHAPHPKLIVYPAVIRNPALERLSLPALKWILHTMQVSANSNLSTIDMPEINFISGNNYTIEVIFNSPNLCLRPDLFANVTAGSCHIANPKLDADVFWSSSTLTTIDAPLLPCDGCCDALVVAKTTGTVCEYASQAYLKSRYPQLRV